MGAKWVGIVAATHLVQGTLTVWCPDQDIRSSEC